jgi:fatty acyl-CoA reductase
VYNFVSSTDNPVTWGDFREKSIRHAYNAPPQQAIWSISLGFHTSRPFYLFTVFFLHLLPAFVIDTVASFFGSSTK